MSNRNRFASRMFLWLAVFLSTAWVQLGFVPSAATAQPPIDADEGLSVVSWSNADKVVGKTAVVTGKIVALGRSGRVNFLNFDATRRDVFKVVVFADHLSKFPKSLSELYHNQLVAVRGRVTLYKGVPQIEVTAPSQIRIVRSLPKSRIVEPKSRKLSKRVRIATFNVRNLFDDHDDPYYADETTVAKPRAELERLAGTINEIDADAIALQEVESRGYLERFNDVFLGDMSYEVVHYSGNDGRGSGLAVLSRIPIGQVTSHRHRRFQTDDGKPTRFSRDLLCVELRHPFAPSFEVWVTHLKSKRGGAAETEPQRVAEVKEIRRIVAEKIRTNADARVLLMGDFNDTKESRPIRLLLEDPNLSAFFDHLPANTFTYNLDPYKDMIDFVFASRRASSGYVDGSYRVVNQSLQQSGSDHNPVVAEFEFQD